MRYCYACHGDKGDGNGPAAAHHAPAAARSSRTGVFKFAGVAAGELPNDDDLDTADQARARRDAHAPLGHHAIGNAGPSSST